MFAKPKSSVFIDSVVFECDHKEGSACLRAVLKDEQGNMMSEHEAEIPGGQKHYSWRGLNDLPYGVYLLELSAGEQESKLRMIKRV
jgi:hypothetical protein